jgi:hypothetical protein
MPILRNERQEIVIREPGFRALARIGELPGGFGAPDLSAAGVLSSGSGDFVVVPRHPDREEGLVTVNGRLPLGGLQRLEDGDVVHFDQHVSGAAGRRCRLIYLRQGSPVCLRLPREVNVRCAYSSRPLAGRRAVRCSQCFLLYDEKMAWLTELQERCPACGWSENEGDHGAH